MAQLTDYLNKILSESPARIILSNPKNKSHEFRKIVITDKVRHYQAEKFTPRQVFHQAIPAGGLMDYLSEHLNGAFLQLNSFHGAYEYGLRITKKGKVFLSKNDTANKAAPSEAHNRKKNYILQEGQIIAPLVDMGVLTAEGKVIQAMYDKFKQINRFIEMVDDSIEDSVTELNVVDFGCGKSYLTFLLYYYFTSVRRIKVRMVGLDLKEDVIRKCNLVAGKYKYENLSFQLGDIRSFAADFPVDMVVSLHACDTATDDALLRAVMWGAKMIFAVPCCQHEFNHQIATDRYSIVTRYGIVKERISAALTDAVRANLLYCCGYSAQLLEFIDTEHTPKNILIRAVRADIPPAVKARALEEVRRLAEEFHLSPALLKLLEMEGMLP